MTAVRMPRSQAALTLLGAVATGDRDDARSALGLVLAAVGVDLHSPTSVRWIAGADPADRVRLTGWHAADLRALCAPHSLDKRATPAAEFAFSSAEALELSWRLLDLDRCCSTHVDQLALEIIGQRAA